MDLAKAFGGIALDALQKLGPVAAIPCMVVVVLAILFINSRKSDSKITAAETIITAVITGVAFVSINVWLPPLRGIFGI